MTLDIDWSSNISSKHIGHSTLIEQVFDLIVRAENLKSRICLQEQVVNGLTL